MKNHEQKRILEGNLVYLKPISIKDTDIYLETLFNPETRRLTGTQAIFTREQIYDYLERKSKDTTTSILLLIIAKETNQVIGDIALQSIDHLNRNANIRISIENQVNRGKGYGTEALQLLLEHGFGVLNLHRIELNVFAYNEKAYQVYEKIGFKKEGIQRDALYYDFKYHDSILMAILEEEYKEKYKK
ncbi:GNAT family protein [Bacillus sp. FJAT-49736]|uniref:GNAT family N-acetyltransferase n=1 Tax=Bacillus sp. FJAT-49736 TaxID=2833582 RepID=UPI001BC95258|nr:GNAT family protein [Bacillus sp. FJAT-49736]MBS4174102.1 GNAT family N-acetyltransferase [Bacillus sp. FJAT-49736]